MQLPGHGREWMCLNCHTLTPGLQITDCPNEGSFVSLIKHLFIASISMHDLEDQTIGWNDICSTAGMGGETDTWRGGAFLVQQFIEDKMLNASHSTR